MLVVNWENLRALAPISREFRALLKNISKCILFKIRYPTFPIQVSDLILIGFKRMIDSAQAYNEEQVGTALEESGLPREEVFITSKVHPRFLGYDETLQSVEESLKKLKV